MRARKTGICAATGRPVKAYDLIFKSVFGWALFDAEAFAAVRAGVASGVSQVDRTVTFDRPATGTLARDYKAIREGRLSDLMDAEDSIY